MLTLAADTNQLEIQIQPLLEKNKSQLFELAGWKGMPYLFLV